MTDIDVVGHRLKNKAVFLSASVPKLERAKEFQDPGASPGSDQDTDVYERISNAHFEIDQAVISLARAIFCEGGRLVFGGHPSISPLVATVAGEYREPRQAESREERPSPPVIIYQSRAFESHAPEQTLLMFKLGVAEIRWTQAVDGERFEPGHELRGPPCPQSIEAMRRKMIDETDPVAMVCVGGMAGVRDEVRMFVQRYPDKPVYALRRTGGAAAILNRDDAPNLRLIDDEIMESLASRGLELGPSEDRELSDMGLRSIPYPLIMQTIVDEIAESGSSRTPQGTSPR